MPTSTAFAFIILTGFATITTDLRSKQISNLQLIIIASGALLVHGAFLLTGNTFPALPVLSLIVAAAIGWIFYRHHLWRAGDAKLFMLYAFLMPPTGYENLIPLPGLVLFINTFLIAFAFLMPELIRDMTRNHRRIFLRLIARPTRIKAGQAILLAVGVLWAVIPFLQKLGLTQYGFLSFLAVYLALYLLFDAVVYLFKYPAVLLIICAAGFYGRIVSSPGFFSWQNILTFTVAVVIYPAGTFLLNNAIQRVARHYERLPFAPFFFIGCLLSYSSLLTWAMRILSGR